MEFDVDLELFSVRYDGLPPEYIPEIVGDKLFFDIDHHKKELIKDVAKNRKRLWRLMLFEAYCLWLQTSFADEPLVYIHEVKETLNKIARNVPDHNRLMSKAFEEDLA